MRRHKPSMQAERNQHIWGRKWLVVIVVYSSYKGWLVYKGCCMLLLN